MIQPLSIAFYLPQFHPTPENSSWWGEGFTEWTNVTKALPLYAGHHQPFLPSDLGFYDLRCAESRLQQADLAAQFGVSAFCYWHYWFGGRRILDRPFQEVLDSKEPSFPFCLGWANQTWSGTWHGAPDRILIEQTYPGFTDDEKHFEFLYSAFSDPRYLKIEGKPLFYIFRPEDLPNAKRWSESIDVYMKNRGLPGVFLVGEISDLLGKGPKSQSADKYGFDAMVYMRLPANTNLVSTIIMRARRKVLGHPEVYPAVDKLWDVPQGIVSSHVYPCVYTNWDNTPRSGTRGLVIEGCTPSFYERQLDQAFEHTMNCQASKPIVFIKSWNEWAEGNVLEPSIRYGRGFLEAHKRVVDKYSR